MRLLRHFGVCCATPSGAPGAEVARKGRGQAVA